MTTKPVVLALLALFLLLAGTGPAAAATEISVGTPDLPITIGETAKIPITISGADNLTSLTMQIGSSSAAQFDQTEHPLGGTYTFNPNNGKLVWLSTIPVSGDRTITYLLITPKTAENVPVELKLLEATARPSVSGGSEDITADTILAKNITIKVAGAEITATIAPTKIATLLPPEETLTPTITKTPVSTPAATSANPGVTTPQTTRPTTEKTTLSQTTQTPVPALTQASIGIMPILGLLAALGAAALLRRN